MLEVVVSGDKSNGFKPMGKRWIVEKTFSWFDNYRRICRNYEFLLTGGWSTLVYFPPALCLCIYDKIKKVCSCLCMPDFNSLYSRNNYSAVASVATVSLLTLSTAAAASAAAASTAAIESAIRIESCCALAASAALFPQDANDTAAIATAIKTNFFIFFAF